MEEPHMASGRGMAFRLAWCVLSALIAAGCSAAKSSLSNEVRVGSSRPMPSPPVRANNAAPQIVAMRFNTLEVQRPSVWTGRIVTSTNVASLEVRTNLFSIDTSRITFGRFAFAVNVYDLPSIFIRGYRVRVIARNSAGVEAEEDVPLRIR
jgi:hypothetical protein